MKSGEVFLLLFTLSTTLVKHSEECEPTMLDTYVRACRYAYLCIVNNKYFFTFEGKGAPEEEEFGHLGFIQPYFAEFNPKRPLGRHLEHTENPTTSLSIPKLLPANCLDQNKYPWNILCSGSDGWEWDWQRQLLYQQHNVAAYKAGRSSILDLSDPQSAMSTIRRIAQQSSYP